MFGLPTNTSSKVRITSFLMWGQRPKHPQIIRPWLFHKILGTPLFKDPFAFLDQFIGVLKTPTIKTLMKLKVNSELPQINYPAASSGVLDSLDSGFRRNDELAASGGEYNPKRFI